VARRSAIWVWVGRSVAAVVVIVLAVRLIAVGLDKADKVASVIGALVGIVGLVASYLFPSGSSSDGAGEPPPGSVTVRDSSGVQINQASGNKQVNRFGKRR
jgi:hypothetical protein